MDLNNDIALNVENNNPPPPLPAVGAATLSNENINYPKIPQNDAQNNGYEITVQNNDNNYADNNRNFNNYVLDNNVNNYYNNNQNKELNYIQSSSDVNVKADNLNSSFHINLFIDYDIMSKYLMKVYGILLFQFIFIFALVLIFQIQSIKDYLHGNVAFLWAFLGISIFVIVFTYLLFVCCPDVLRRVPCNYIILFILTFFLGIFCAFIASFYHYQAVLGAITCVIAICIGSFCIGLFNKGGNIKAWFFIISSAICLVIHYAIMALIFRSYYYIFLYDTAFAILYSLYIAFDTIVIKESYSLDDYILAAIILTIDIIRLFLILLKIFGSSNNNK